jgi:hypothetical protein
MSTSSEFLCVLCRKPVDLTIDLNADETGKTVHQPCYLKKISGVDFAETSRNRVG